MRRHYLTIVAFLLLAGHSMARGRSYGLAAIQNADTPAIPKPENEEICAALYSKETSSASAATSTARTWPQTVRVDRRATEIRIGKEDRVGIAYVYCSENFQFAAPAVSTRDVLTELALVAEASRLLVQSMPLEIQARTPSGFFRAKLYDTREEYAADLKLTSADNVPSYAMYDGRERIIRIPFNFEMRQKDGVLTMFRKIETHPVMHEITHQMMHDYLQFLPHWVAEGLAEYVAMLPYNHGAFSASEHERGLKEYLKSQARDTKLSDLGRVADLIRMSPEQWNATAVKGGVSQRRLYISSLLLVYYFSHLDGDRRGERLLRYFDKMAEARDAWRTFFASPQVRLTPNGTFLSSIALPPYPSTFGIQNVDIFFDGRGPEEIQKAFVEAYKKLGIR